LVSNTGAPPQIPLEQVFERFKRSNANDESVGLGLAIVKQICEVSNLVVKYEYVDGRHVLSITFNAA
jgi:signal transduction histidine kinase